MFGGRAIAVVAIRCAYSVTVLRDFAGEPIRGRQRCNDVAHQLRFADAASVPAHHD
jgi:hypothetical protein